MKIIHAWLTEDTKSRVVEYFRSQTSDARLGLSSNGEVDRRPVAVIDPGEFSERQNGSSGQDALGFELNYVSSVELLSQQEIGMAEPGAFVVLGTWPVDVDTISTFRNAALTNARLSVDTEPGCSFFHVLQDVDKPEVFFLLEGFRSPHDFEQHLTSSHFENFATVARPLFRGDRALTIRGALRRGVENL